MSGTVIGRRHRSDRVNRSACGGGGGETVQEPRKMWKKPELLLLSSAAQSAAGVYANGLEGAVVDGGTPIAGPFYQPSAS